MPGSDVYDTIKSDVSVETATQINQGTVGLSDAPNAQQPIIGEQTPGPTTPVSTIDENAASTGGIWREEFPSDQAKYYMTFHVYDYKRADFVSLGNLNLVGMIRMPISAEIKDDHSVNWGEEEVGMGVGMAAGAAKALGMDAIETIQSKKGMEMVNELIRNNLPDGKNKDKIAELFMGSGIAAIEMGAKGASAVGFGGVGTAIKALSGYSPNKFLTILFKGATYKRHQFHWKLVPKNADESERIRKIIKAFNNTAAPGHAFGGAIFKFPRIIIPSFVPNPKYLYKFKPSVITHIHHNFAPGGQPAFYYKKNELDAEAPESVMLSISTVELEYWMTGDFNDSNDPGRVYDGTTGETRNLENGKTPTLNELRWATANANKPKTIEDDVKGIKDYLKGFFNK